MENKWINWKRGEKEWNIETSASLYILQILHFNYIDRKKRSLCFLLQEHKNIILFSYKNIHLKFWKKDRVRVLNPSSMSTNTSTYPPSTSTSKIVLEYEYFEYFAQLCCQSLHRLNKSMEFYLVWTVFQSNSIRKHKFGAIFSISDFG